MIETLLSNFLLAQQISPRAINRSAVSQQVSFYVQVGNPTKKAGEFYVDPVAMTEKGTPSFNLEPGVQLSARKVALAPGRERRVNARAEIGNVNREFYVCTSPVEPTLIREGNGQQPALGIRARACSLVQLKQLNRKGQE